MFTIDEYINSLKADKEHLVEYLTTKGITASSTETFTTLVPKVLDIVTANLQSKSVTITTNTTTNLTPDTGYNGFSSVEVITNVLPSGTLNITSNGVYDVTNYASADVNVQLDEYFSTAVTPYMSMQNNIITETIKRIQPIDTSSLTSGEQFFAGCVNLIEIPLINTSNMTNMANMFYNCSSLTAIPSLNTSSCENMNSIFQGCSSLTSVPTLDMSNVTACGQMFSRCSNLTTVPVLDLSSTTNVFYMFNNCPNLSNDSLNNIMASCISATSYTGTKTLSYLGLNATQIATCQTLSNYTAFVNAGWSAS